MRNYPTRKEQIIEKIEIFQDNPEKQTLDLLLYKREIQFVSQNYPTITVEQKGQYKNTYLCECTIYKK